jgi:poly(A) polymerase
VLFRYVTDKDGRPVKKAVIYSKSEHSIDSDKVDPDARRIIAILKQRGYEAYIVGGAVRDLLLGKTPKDFDIATDATPQNIKRVFYNARIIGKRFRLVHVIFGRKIFEVCTFRSTADGTTGNSFGTIHEDALRRDFTLNALYYDPVTERLIDYVGGVQDIEKKVLSPVIPLKCIFEEDPVRMVRGVKYAASTGFAIPFLVKRQIKKNAPLLFSVSPSRLTEELVKIVNSPAASKIVCAAMDMGIYPYLQPAASALCESSKEFKARYLGSLAALDAAFPENAQTSATPVRYGERLAYFLIDYIATLRDWSKELARGADYHELLNWTWAQCRSFVLPMNPQRSELDYAVAKALADLGVTPADLRKRRTRSRGHRREKPRSEAAAR